jgi:PHD/YefM family antitoxin component YafN of YafNO toxin-antitoxin module
MKVVSLDKAGLNLPDVVALAKEGPVILTRNGKPLAAVKDLSGSDWESIALANNPQFLALIEESRRSYREVGGIGLDGLCDDLGLKKKAAIQKKKKKT